jgi:exosome complex exonuclease DIS3/RRP44
MDLFEVETAFKDVIVLQTVLEEVKNRSLPLYHRLVSLTKNEDKRFYVFFNEFRMETYVKRDQGETINDRNDRAVRRSVAWYGEHLKTSMGKQAAICPTIVMISDDRDCLQKGKSEGLSAFSLHDYVSGLDNANDLIDMVTTGKERKAPGGPAELIYPEVCTCQVIRKLCSHPDICIVLFHVKNAHGH